MAALSAPTSQGFRCAVICITELLLVCTTAHKNDSYSDAIPHVGFFHIIYIYSM